MKDRRQLFSALGFFLVCVLVSLAALQAQPPLPPTAPGRQTALPAATVPLSKGEPYIPHSVMPDLIGEPAETTTADIAEVLASYTCDNGTEVLFYLSAAGDKYCAYIPHGTEQLIRFTFENNGYTDGYSFSAYENVLGHSGFRIECPRGAAYYGLDYYYFDQDGQLHLLADCASAVLETDLDGDGQKELTYSYHGWQLYYDYLLDGQVYTMDLSLTIRDALSLPESVNVGLTVPETTADFAAGETDFSVVDYQEKEARQILSGTIRLTADAVEIYTP